MVEIMKGITEETFTEVSLPPSIKAKRIVLKGTYSLLGILKNTEE
jgi:hypothetical protein